MVNYRRITAKTFLSPWLVRFNFIAGSCLVLIAILVSCNYTWAAEDDPKASIQLNRHEVRAGDQIRIHEAFAIPEGYSVIQVGYDAEMLAFFHRSQKKNLYLDDTFGRIVVTGFIEGVPRAIASPHGLSLKRRKDGRLERAETIKAKIPGIYLISARFTLRDRDGNTFKLTSNSTILIVAPGQGSVSELVNKRWEALEQLSGHTNGISEDGLP